MRWIGCEGVCGKIGFFTIRFNLDSKKQISKDGSESLCRMEKDTWLQQGKARWYCRYVAKVTSL